MVNQTGAIVVFTRIVIAGAPTMVNQTAATVVFTRIVIAGAPTNEYPRIHQTVL